MRQTGSRHDGGPSVRPNAPIFIGLKTDLGGKFRGLFFILTPSKNLLNFYLAYVRIRIERLINNVFINKTYKERFEMYAKKYIG